MHNCLCCNHRRRSGWNSGGTHGERRRWVGAAWGGVWGGVSLLQPTRGSGERRQLPQRVRGRALAENGLWHILKATGRPFLYLYYKIWGGTICISVPATPDSKEDLSPPWSTPMVATCKSLAGGRGLPYPQEPRLASTLRTSQNFSISFILKCWHLCLCFITVLTFYCHIDS